MKVNNEIIKEVNEEGKEIVKQITVTRETNVKKLDNEQEYKSVFYYKVNKESDLHKEGNVDTVVLEITHLNPIDYKKFHESLMIESWALEMLGYDMVEDKDIWVEKLKTDKSFELKLGDLLDTLIPISKEEYDSLNSKIN